MSNSPIVSVIIPAYNASRYLKETIESLLVQSYSNLEIIIINDGSTDDTETVIRPFLTEKRIKYFSQANGGISKARNKGVVCSQGVYIAFLDADDLALPERIEEQVDFLEKNSDYGVAYSQFQSFIEGRSRRLFTYRRTGFSGNIFQPLLQYSFICPSTVMLRRKVFDDVGGFDEQFRDAEDWDLWRRLAYRGVLFGFIDKPLVLTRLHPQSLSGFANQVRMKKMNLYSFEKLFNQMTETERVVWQSERIVARLRMKLAIAHLLLGERAKARFRSKESGFCYWPFVWLLTFLPSGMISYLVRKTWGWKQAALFKRI